MFNDDLDLCKIMRCYAQMNPHIAHAEIAFLMDLPCDDEVEYDDSPVFE
ncbi:hypothetical protein MMIC_P0438 [Mariprofundus micogutta]|uniref:Uncharacterized protein n=1 Tax=Mariprofundus micogutta TaxID=1921010 RepID=A0A1L8CKR1_9PROT|nr:hypothetical protein [Mariprofundus micogutta]GAV19504.1 hypothetical protein MMIC_P0438 [Mariprofundus micogutta]